MICKNGFCKSSHRHSLNDWLSSRHYYCLWFSVTDTSWVAEIYTLIIWEYKNHTKNQKRHVNFNFVPSAKHIWYDAVREQNNNVHNRIKHCTNNQKNRTSGRFIYYKMAIFAYYYQTYLHFKSGQEIPFYIH